MLQRVIDQRRKDLGGFEVGRVLPFGPHKMVGPFIFFDHIGPANFAPGLARSADVRPHPHIGLATVTYLFEGEIMHRDSVGSQEAIHPGEVNWMTAGSGITHSERFEKIREVAESAGHTVAELVVNWTISQHGITSALCGAKRPYQIEETAGAMGWQLTAEQLAAIDAAIAARGPTVTKRAFS